LITLDEKQTSDKPVTVRLILHPGNRGWILEKFAARLVENLPNWNIKADVSDRPSAAVDVNHWMLYLHFKGEQVLHSTISITHIDHPKKLWELKASLDIVDAGICLSRMTVEDLVRQGIERKKLCYITPAHDGLVSPRRIVIGITSRVYGDGRKREDLLKTLAKSMKLNIFHFEIFGQGWIEIIPYLKSAGATVQYYPDTEDYEQDYKILIDRVPTFDYYLYTGLDEGSMGLFDALAAGVATIVTPQGFHLDIESGITHPFQDVIELREVFAKIAKERQQRVTSVKNLTWKEYARKHAIVWRMILNRQHMNIPDRLNEGTGTMPPMPNRSIWNYLLTDIQFYGKPALRRLQRLIRR